LSIDPLLDDMPLPVLGLAIVELPVPVLLLAVDPLGA
jgi:hypothetical protein